MIPPRFQPVLDELAPLTERFAAAGHRLYLVGGTVRDLLASATTTATIDFDVTTDARPDADQGVPAAAGPTRCGPRASGSAPSARRRTTATYEITTHRAEAYHEDSRKPDVEFADEIEADLSRRDFTINAMALELTADDADAGRSVRRRGRSADAHAAHAAVARGQLQRRSVAHAARRAVHRPLQRQPVTASSSRRCAAMHGRLSIVSAERIRDELDKLITVDAPHGRAVVRDRHRPRRRVPARAAGDAARAGPDPSAQGRAHPHARGGRERRARACPTADFDFRRTRLAALFHDVGKPRTRGYQKGKGVTFHHHDAVGARMTRKRLEALRYSNDDVEAITELVALHLRFHTY